jgi:hypothetical protein
MILRTFRVAQSAACLLRAADPSRVRRGPHQRETNKTETVECDPSFRMAERVSPLRPLSMTTAKAVAAFGGGLKGHH